MNGWSPATARINPFLPFPSHPHPFVLGGAWEGFCWRLKGFRQGGRRTQEEAGRWGGQIRSGVDF